MSDDDLFDSDFPEPMIFRPSLEEFRDLETFLTSIEAQGAGGAGICKIITPAGYQPRKTNYHTKEFNFKIEKPLKQVYSAIPGIDGGYTTNCQPQEGMLVEEYSEMTETPIFATPPHDSHVHLEKIFWQQMKESNIDPIYGADVTKSLMDQDLPYWNFQNLKTILNEGMDNAGLEVGGVNTPYLYFGAWRTTFSWHVEDMDLYGVNYMHHGAPKTWYCLPSSLGYKLEKLAGDLLPDQARCCTNFLRHKTVMLSPELLRKHGMEVSKIVQTPGDIIMVFPHAYHAGFNHGYNIAEAINIALPRWVEYGKRYRGCDCADSSMFVNLDMTYYVEKFQPEKYELWKDKKDIGPHPDDPVDVKNFFKAVMDSGDPKTFLDMIDKNTIPKQFKFTYEKITGIPIISYTNKALMDVSTSCGESDHDIDWKPKSNNARKKRKIKVRVKDTSCSNKDARCENTCSHKVHNSDEDWKPHSKKNKKISTKPAGPKCEESHRYMPCGECEGCLRPNCGDCWTCYDTPRFGGSGPPRQRCESRICSKRLKVKCPRCKW